MAKQKPKKPARGRPKLPDSERRTMTRFPVRWSETEAIAIQTAAERADVSASALARAGALELASQPVKAIREAVEQHGQK